VRCPTCKKEFYPQPDQIGSYWEDQDEGSTGAFRFSIQQCPSCYETIVIREKGTGSNTGFEDEVWVADITETLIIYPQANEFSVAPEVPEDLAGEFQEANAALEYSAKASSALSRRLLQKVLRENLGITKRDLSLEIDEFIASSKAPTYLTNAIDAIRQIGNFATHPIKYTSTGEIVDVEPGEAEWMLEVVDSLFDFVFVQPTKLQARRDSLNQKLKEIGKPPLKGE
jgi:hypothetical protein